MTEGPSGPIASVESILAAVRAAGEGIHDAKEARAARQARAAQEDIVSAIAAMREGSPDAMALRAGLKSLSVSGKAIDASVKWYRAHASGRGSTRGQDDRPVIRLGPWDSDVDVDKAIEHLAADPELYVRGSELVRVIRDDEGAAVIRSHTASTLRLRLSRYIRFVSEDGRAIPPPVDLTQAILELREWPGLRQLAGISDTPIARKEGSIMQTPGYDPSTRTIFAADIEFPEVPEAPTHQQACDALQLLWTETSYDFPFRGLGYAKQGQDPVFRYLDAQSCPHAWGIVATILTIVGRRAIDGDVPAIIFDAAGPGSGKGLSTDVACLATMGRIPAKITWPNHGERGETDAEAEKRLVSKVLSGAQVIVWDEILGAFGGPAINNVLTCGGRTSVRRLGSSEDITVPYSAVTLGTGNNVSMRDNTHRRAIVPRIESPEEDPENHTGWRVPDLRAHVKAKRPELIAAALTVIRGYVVAGKPDVGLPIWGGGFESWSALIARAIKWAGGGNILDCRPSANPDARNEEREAVGAVLKSIERVEPRDEHGGQGITLSTYLDTLYPSDRLKGQAPPDGHEAAREAIEALTNTAPGKKPAAKRLGDKLHTWKRRPIGGARLDVAPQKESGNVSRWTVKRE